MREGCGDDEGGLWRRGRGVETREGCGDEGGVWR